MRLALQPPGLLDLRPRRLLRLAARARAYALPRDRAVMRAKTLSGRGFIWCYADNRYVGDRERAAALSASTCPRARGRQMSSRGLGPAQGP